MKKISCMLVIGVLAGGLLMMPVKSYAARCLISFGGGYGFWTGTVLPGFGHNGNIYCPVAATVNAIANCCT